MFQRGRFSRPGSPDYEAAVIDGRLHDEVVTRLIENVLEHMIRLGCLSTEGEGASQAGTLRGHERLQLQLNQAGTTATQPLDGRYSNLESLEGLTMGVLARQVPTAVLSALAPFASI